MQYSALTKDEQKTLLKEEIEKHKELVKKGYSLDISRGKPCKEQLDGVMHIFDCVQPGSKLIFTSDYRNYGDLLGIPQMRKLFGDILGVPEQCVIVGDSSSLNLMYDAIQRAMQFGVCGGKPWNGGQVKFICPAPGYDRHFAICEHFGIDMITVPMDENGPDMEIVENIVESDPNVKGMWCVPKYSNPTGITYSDEVVERLAKMKSASADFRLFYDNAYAVHFLYDTDENLKNIYQIAKEVGTEDRLYMFTSTSKITFPGSGVACIACSEKNVADITSHYKFQTIGPNKVNQFMHAEYIKSLENLKGIMTMHASIIRPKFDKILNALQLSFGESTEVVWSKPKGGYFISLDVLDGCATNVGKLCKEAGLTLTAVGATYPLGRDDNDRNLRIAPTFIKNEELDIACEILINSIKIAVLQHIEVSEKR